MTDAALNFGCVSRIPLFRTLPNPHRPGACHSLDGYPTGLARYASDFERTRQALLLRCQSLLDGVVLYRKPVTITTSLLPWSIVAIVGP